MMIPNIIKLKSGFQVTPLQIYIPSSVRLARNLDQLKMNMV